MEKWPYPSVPVYVVCPRDWEGCRWTLHRNYLLPISSNLEQGKKDEPMVGVRNGTSPPLEPSVDSTPAEAGLSGMVTSTSVDNTPQGSPDQPAPLRHGTWDHQESTSLEVPKFWFVGQYWTNKHLGCMGWPVYLPMCCDLSVCHFSGMYSVEHTLLVTPYICKAQLTSVSRGTLSMQLLRWIPGQGREWTKGHLAQLQLPYQSTSSPKAIPNGAWRSVRQFHPKKQVTDLNQQKQNKQDHASMIPQCTIWECRVEIPTASNIPRKWPHSLQ